MQKDNRLKCDPFGFRFWLGWILGFVSCFFISAGLWTLLITRTFGAIKGSELTLTWCVAVFGTWFLFLTPFMRKKERIWKRLNHDQEKAADLWLAGMAVYIGALIASSLLWSFVFRGDLHRESAGLYGPWLKAVVATWLVALIPFLVVMYRKADMLFKEAHERQTSRGPKFQSTLVEKAARQLPVEIAAQISTFPEMLENGRIITLKLKDGREIRNVFVINSREVIGLYDCESMNFKTADVIGVQSVDSEKLPLYDETRWLRLDGRV
jgi:uncharacterized membrane protein